ncbi:unnamed protein product [Meganyctiphanes norvegica]|uniref:Uncharacterized protein n=1 Tax=Meganyctiphanes norvegica TaxID=48144 RepID=A0AAV2PSF4_MEGNR
MGAGPKGLTLQLYVLKSHKKNKYGFDIIPPSKYVTWSIHVPRYAELLQHPFTCSIHLHPTFICIQTLYIHHLFIYSIPLHPLSLYIPHPLTYITLLHPIPFYI